MPTSFVLIGLAPARARASCWYMACHRNPNIAWMQADEGEIVCCKFVVTSRDTTTLLDFSEEPFDQISCAIKMPRKQFLLFGNVGGSPTPGNRIGETALAGWAWRIRTGTCHFEGCLFVTKPLADPSTREWFG